MCREDLSLTYTYHTLHIPHATHTTHTTHYTYHTLHIPHTTHTTYHTLHIPHTTHTKHYTYHTLHILHTTYSTYYDTNIFLSGNNLKEMTETFNVELTKIHKWLEVNKLSINIDKTNYIIFRSKKKHKAPKLNIAIDGKILEMVNQNVF